MQITRHRLHRVNLGQGTYEYVEFGASVTLDTGTDEVDEDVVTDLNRILDDLLREDMDEAVANVPSGESTHAETWRK